MSELDQCITVLLDPRSSSDLKQRALDYTHSVKLDPCFISFAMEKTLELNLDNPQASSVMFFYLDAIEELLERDSENYGERQRKEVREFLERGLGSRGKAIQAEAGLRNKVAGIYGRVAVREFGKGWGGAFEKVMEAATTPHSQLFFLSVLQHVYDDFFDDSDSPMPCPERSLVYLQSEFLPTALSTCKPYVSDPVLSSPCLFLLASYTPWLPLDLVLSLLPSLEDCKTTTGTLHCIRRLIMKPMDSLEQKIDVISRLQIVPWLQSLKIESMNFDLRDDLANVALLINDLGLELIELGRGGVQPVLDLAMDLMSNREDMAVGIVLEFVCEYVRWVKETSAYSLNGEQRGNVDRLCDIVRRQCQLQGNPQRGGGEATGEEDSYRYKRRKPFVELFLSLMTAESTTEAALDFLSRGVRDITGKSEACKAEEVEAVLFLVNKYGKTATDLAKTLVEGSKQSYIVRTIFESGVSDMQHKIVIKQFLGLSVQYSSFFEPPSRAPLLPNVLGPLLTHLSHRDPDICMLSSSLLYQLLLKLPSAVSPQANTLFSHIEDRLSAPIDDISAIHLSKTVGLIVSNPATALDTQRSLLQRFIARLRSPATASTVNRAAEVVGAYKRQAPSEVYRELAAIGEFVLNGIKTQTVSQPLYDSALFFYKRVVEAMATAATQMVHAAMSALMVATSSLDVLENLMKVSSSSVRNRCVQFLGPAFRLPSRSADQNDLRRDVDYSPSRLSSVYPPHQHPADVGASIGYP